KPSECTGSSKMKMHDIKLRTSHPITKIGKGGRDGKPGFGVACDPASSFLKSFRLPPAPSKGENMNFKPIFVEVVQEISKLRLRSSKPQMINDMRHSNFLFLPVFLHNLFAKFSLL
ncbi:MAG: hypothetical protein R6V19_08350, partial [Armatimonadota bacterium]